MRVCVGYSELRVRVLLGCVRYHTVFAVFPRIRLSGLVSESTLRGRSWVSVGWEPTFRPSRPPLL